MSPGTAIETAFPSLTIRCIIAFFIEAPVLGEHAAEASGSASPRDGGPDVGVDRPELLLEPRGFASRGVRPTLPRQGLRQNKDGDSLAAIPVDDYAIL